MGTEVGMHIVVVVVIAVVADRTAFAVEVLAVTAMKMIESVCEIAGIEVVVVVVMVPVRFEKIVAWVDHIVALDWKCHR